MSDNIERYLARAERLAAVSDYGGIAEAERARRVAEVKRSTAPRILEIANILLTGGDLNQTDLINVFREPHHSFWVKLFVALDIVVSGVMVLGLIWFMNGASLFASLGLVYFLSAGLTTIGLTLKDMDQVFRTNKLMGPMFLTVFIMSMLWFFNTMFPQWVLLAYVPCLIPFLVLNVLSYPQKTHASLERLRKSMDFAIQIFPGYLLAVITLNAIAHAVSAVRGVQLTDTQRSQKELERLRALPAGELVREYAVREIQKIEKDLLGSGSEMRRVETSLQSRLDGAEAMRLQISSRTSRGGDAMRQGLKVAEERVGELRKVLTRHRDVIARASAILSECMTSARGLSDAVADAELLKNLEEQAMEDQKHVALSELAMDQAVGQLRVRVMSLEGVLAQLETKRLTDADPSRDEQEAYLERIEMVATRLASV